MEYNYWNGDIGKALLLMVFTFLLVSVVIFTLAQYDYFANANKSITSSEDAVIVFVTAHPDDECMFFGPAILQTVRQNPNNVHLLCLTTGNFDNKGKVRSKELYESCKVLGISTSNVVVLDNSSFPDGHRAWDFDVLLPEILKYMRGLKPDYIFTFDSYGVSGHLNHIETSRAIRLLYKRLKPKEKIPVIFELESVPLYRKYISFMDAPASVVYGRSLFVSSLSDVLKSQNAMRAHKSQFVWFRRLYIIFSRYMLINTFKEVNVDTVS